MKKKKGKKKTTQTIKNDSLPCQTLVCFGGAAPGTDRRGLSGRCSQTPVWRQVRFYWILTSSFRVSSWKEKKKTKEKKKKKKNHPVNPMCPRSRSAKRSVLGEETADKGRDKKKKKTLREIRKKKKRVQGFCDQQQVSFMRRVLREHRWQSK